MPRGIIGHGWRRPVPGASPRDRAVALIGEFSVSASEEHPSSRYSVRAGAQPVADHLFPPPDGGLGPSAFVVPGPLLPSPAAVLGDALEMAVARRRRGRGSHRWHRARTRW